MRNMFRMMKKKLEEGEDLVLVTVVASSGSTPRGAGSRMLIGKEGRLAGTIGGGAVEYRSQHIAAEVLKEKSSGERDFTLTKDDVQKLGMICGGAVRVFFQFIAGGDAETLAVCGKAEELFAAGRDLWLISDLGNGGKLGLFSPEEGAFSVLDAPAWLAENLTRHPVRLEKDGRDIYAEQIGSSGVVYVFGGGHVAQELVPVLSHVGFRCVVLDDREEFTAPELFPAAERTILCDFERLSDFISVTEEDYCCVMTRGHSFDTVVQAQLLRTPACYIGVIGSRHKKAGVFQRLVEEFGIPEQELERITTPIGLSIRAETPAEIAISIAGQMIELRAARNGK